MEYAIVNSSLRPRALVAVEPSNWGAPYQELFDQTDVAGYERWLLEGANNFKNPVAEAMEALHKQRGYFAIIFRDTVEEGGKGADKKARLDVIYTSHAGTEWEKRHRVLAPPSGWYVPTDDDIRGNGVWIPFHQGTLIPRETVQDRKEAVKRLEARGIDPRWVSNFWRPESYKEKRFVGRGFFPVGYDGGRFDVGAGRPPSDSGDDWVASLRAYGKPEVVMEAVETLLKKSD